VLRLRSVTGVTLPNEARLAYATTLVEGLFHLITYARLTDRVRLANRAGSWALSRQQVSYSRNQGVCVMRRKIGTAFAAFVLLPDSSLVSLAQTGGSP
jgi:hypothetical protein